MSAWRPAIAGSIVAVMVCLAAGLLLGGDPLMPVEVAGAIVSAIWLLKVLAATSRAHQLARSLEAVSREAIVTGVACRVIDEGGRSAFALGTLRPRIYLGAGLLTTLDVEELRAVMLHEEHHRRSRAPLRTAALGAWWHLARSSTGAREALDARLAQIEVDADRFALKHGVSRRAIAGALLKTEWSPMGLGFGVHAQARVDHLLDAQDGGLPEQDRAVPYEWAPVVVALGIIVACHVGL